MQALAAVGATVSLQEDAHSLGVAAATMRALTPAWLAAGKPAGALVSAILSAASRMTPHRRLNLLSGLLQALPEVRLPLPSMLSM